MVGDTDFDFYYDTNNIDFGTQTSILSSAGNTGAFSGEGTSTAILDPLSPHSLTIIATIDQSSTSVSSFDAEIQAVPLPAAAWLFGSGVLGLLSGAKRRKKAG